MPMEIPKNSSERPEEKIEQVLGQIDSRLKEAAMRLRQIEDQIAKAKERIEKYEERLSDVIKNKNLNIVVYQKMAENYADWVAENRALVEKFSGYKSFIESGVPELEAAKKDLEMILVLKKEDFPGKEDLN